MGKIKSYLKLIRVHQYYKSIVIFLGPFFGGKLLSSSTIINFTYILPLIIGFFLLGMVSSINYIINDLMDIEKDRLHPKKKERPLPSGKVSKIEAYFIIILLIIAICAGLFIINLFSSDSSIAKLVGLMLLGVFINGNIYNYKLKSKAYLDIIALSLMYIWRTWAGCIIADNLYFSPWLFTLVFLFALFLAINKRIADLIIMGEDAHEHKEIYKVYTKESLENLLNMVTISLFIIYTLYCIIRPITPQAGANLEQNNVLLMFSVPVAIYELLRYLYIAKKDPEIAIATEKAIKDYPLVIGGIILAGIIYIANYIEIAIYI